MFPRKAKPIIRDGLRIKWKSTDRSIPVPSSPNQIQSIHFETVAESSISRFLFGWRRYVSHFIEIKNPAKHQIASNINTVKSFIIARSEMKSMLSGIRLNAKRGRRTRAAITRILRPRSPRIEFTSGECVHSHNEIHCIDDDEGNIQE